MSTQKDEPAPNAQLPAVAAEYRKAAGDITSRRLAQAMAQLQRSAARAVFPRDTTGEELAQEDIVVSRLPSVPTSLESAVLAKRRHQNATEREASRLYAGARPFI